MCFMKKKFLGFITFALVFSIGTYALVSFNNQAKVSELQLANIEALSDSEGAAIKKLCSTHCKNRNGFVCILTTSSGIKINCDEMVPWTN